MHILSLVAASVALLCALPASAQEAPSAERLALAQRYLELSQGSAMTDAIKGQLEEAYGQSDLSAPEREWLTTNMTTTITRVMEQSLIDMRDDVALLFTEEELRATIAFYETPIGQSVVSKSFELGVALQETMLPHMMEGITKLSEKYCARFTCESGGAAALGKSRR
ncbi:MAG: DUF2059 domain-containing protein [Brevundimonas sp.]|nr:MAG: DUF2059 domain-containing protein [Brevundimonas sp.]